MVYSIGVQVFNGLFALVAIITQFCCFYFYFWKHRSKPNIQARHAWVTIASYFIILHATVLGVLPSLLRSYQYPCIFTIYEQSTVFTSILWLCVLRLVMLYFDFKLTDEKNEARKGWFLHHKMFFQPSFLLPVYILILVATAVGDWITIFVSFPGAILSHFMSEECFDVFGAFTLFIDFIIRFGVLIPPGVYLIFAIQKWQEAFFIKREFRWFLIGTLTILLPWTPLQFGGFAIIAEQNDEIFPYKDLILIIWLAFFLPFIMYVYPTIAFTSSSPETIKFLSIWQSTRRLTSIKPSVSGTLSSHSRAASAIRDVKPMQLEQFLSIPEFAEALRQVLVKEFCVENIIFLLAVLKIRNEFSTLLDEEEKIVMRRSSRSLSITITDTKKAASLNDDAKVDAQQSLEMPTIHENADTESSGLIDKKEHHRSFSVVKKVRRPSKEVEAALNAPPESLEPYHKQVFELVENHLTKNALLEVNVAQEAYKNARSNIAEIADLDDTKFAKEIVIQDVLGECYKQVFDMVKFGAYGRFLESSDYGNLIRQYQANMDSNLSV